MKLKKFIIIIITLVILFTGNLVCNETVTIGNNWGYKGETDIEIPITSSEITSGENITAVYFQVIFPDSILCSISHSIDTSNAIYGWGNPITEFTNTDSIDIYTVAISNVSPLTCEDGDTLLNLNFDVNQTAAVNDSSKIDLSFFLYNDDEADTESGYIEIRSAGAIEGDIAFSDNSGDTTNVTITLQNDDLSIDESTNPDSNGYFRFDRIETDTFDISASLEHYATTISENRILEFGEILDLDTLVLNYAIYPTISLPSIVTGDSSSVIEFPVTIEEYTEIDSIYSFECELTFNTSGDSIFDSISTINNSSTLTQGWNFNPNLMNNNSEDSDTLTVSAFGPALTGSSGQETLFKLCAHISDSTNTGSSWTTGDTTLIDWENFSINENLVEPITENALFYIVIEDTIRGSVAYYNTTDADDPMLTNCLIQLEGSPTFGNSITLNATTNDSVGFFNFGEIGEGTYTLSPTYIGEDIDETVITPFDASKVSQYVVGLDSTSGDSITAADASGNGDITSYDASLIMQYAVGTPVSPTVGNVVFTPADTTFDNTFDSEDFTEFTAICRGDATGNWKNYSSDRSIYSISYSGKPREITYGFRFEGNIYSLYFNAEISSNLEFLVAELSEDCNNMHLYENVDNNRIKIGSYSSNPVVSSKPLLYLTFNKTNFEKSTLDIHFCFANERSNNIDYELEEGQLTNGYKLALYNNFPNPFTPETNIKFSLPKQENVGLKIYNIKGELVKTLIKKSDTFKKGFHEINWDGTNEFGKRISSGIYFYKLNYGNTSLVKKMILLK